MDHAWAIQGQTAPPAGAVACSAVKPGGRSAWLKTACSRHSRHPTQRRRNRNTGTSISCASVSLTTLKLPSASTSVSPGRVASRCMALAAPPPPTPRGVLGASKHRCSLPCSSACNCSRRTGASTGCCSRTCRPRSWTIEPRPSVFACPASATEPRPRGTLCESSAMARENVGGGEVGGDGGGGGPA